MENTVTAGTKIDTARIFDRFYTGDPSRHGESTGLGLAVVKVLTEKLGGEIAAGMREDVPVSYTHLDVYKRQASRRLQILQHLLHSGINLILI